ncbi:MAG: hypothetical protein IJP61_07490 [Treponema sp.]|nr:hypothetical protein [Treponema sp.]
MFKKIICVLLACFCISASAFSQAKERKVITADDEDWVWYEFKAKVLMKNYKFYAFKTEAQLKNRGPAVLDKCGWGIGPEESLEQFFALHRFEKTVIFDELKAIMKEKGYKYAFTTYKSTTKDSTTYHLITFLYDAETDTMYDQVWSR